jgi:hypothetical protein
VPTSHRLLRPPLRPPHHLHLEFGSLHLCKARKMWASPLLSDQWTSRSISSVKICSSMSWVKCDYCTAKHVSMADAYTPNMRSILGAFVAKRLQLFTCSNHLYPLVFSSVGPHRKAFPATPTDPRPSRNRRTRERVPVNHPWLR